MCGVKSILLIFSGQDKLKRHISSVHEGVKHTCNYCNKIFSRTDKLKLHIRSVHELGNISEDYFENIESESDRDWGKKKCTHVYVS